MRCETWREKEGRGGFNIPYAGYRGLSQGMVREKGEGSDSTEINIACHNLQAVQVLLSFFIPILFNIIT